jgi:hypothetical protein
MIQGMIAAMTELWNGEIESGVVRARNNEWKGEWEGSTAGFIGRARVVKVEMCAA